MEVLPVIDWQTLLAAPYGAHFDTLGGHLELAHRERSRRYRPLEGRGA